MDSICPKCLSQLETKEGAKSAHCPSCGMDFDPSVQGDDLPPIEMAISQSKELDASENSELQSPLTESPSTLQDESDFPSIDAAMEEAPTEDLPPLSPTAAMEVKSDFTKSEAVFQELREFGETMVEDDVSRHDAPTEVDLPEKPSQSPPPVVDEVPTLVSNPEDRKEAIPMTSGALLQGYRISSYFTPISFSQEIDPQAEEPLKEALESFCQRAAGAGGNAVVDLKWNLSSEGSRVLICGTPVKCDRE